MIFAHGRGSATIASRGALRDQGLATLLLDFLTPAEERDHANIFDMQLLASRLSSATDWALVQSETADLPSAISARAPVPARH